MWNPALINYPAASGGELNPSMIQGLGNDTLADKPTVVMDAGIATEDNKVWVEGLH